MRETYLQIDGDTVFIRHSPLKSGRRTILFVHGLGESSLCFLEAFDHLKALDCNLVAPDNVGYGHSSAARDGAYSISSQIQRLVNVVAQLKLGPIVLVGHSLGGVIGTHWTSSDKSGLIEKFANIEGNLTPADITFSKMAVDAFASSGQDIQTWTRWLRTDFMETTILNKFGPDWPSCRRYYASLWFCHPEAFLQNATELYQTSQAPQGDSENAQRYLSITVPKIYFSGSKSVSLATTSFLAAHNLAHHCFKDALHWPMIEHAAQFYPALAKFIA